MDPPGHHAGWSGSPGETRLLERLAERRPFRDAPLGLVPRCAASTRRRNWSPTRWPHAELQDRVRSSGPVDNGSPATGWSRRRQEVIARHRAARYAGRTRLAGLCCGISGDLLALAPGLTSPPFDLDAVPG
ncbi:hypothetical protein HBB16_02990 [Pseudonocardia sp. MCCB 268]|nr:hypothetical protein [Pseudonocardia cytotoxica]